jgi:hypothetical protein
MRRSAVAPPAETVDTNPTGVWMSVCCKCCVLSDRGLYDELITRVVRCRVWSRNLVNEGGPGLPGFCCAKRKKKRQALRLLACDWGGRKRIFELRLSPDTRTKIKYMWEIAINLFYTIREREDKCRRHCVMPGPRNSHEETQGFHNEKSDPDDWMC